MHPVFGAVGAVGASRNERVISCAHGDAAKETWATEGMVTTVARLSVRATYGPLRAPVWA